MHLEAAVGSDRCIVEVSGDDVRAWSDAFETYFVADATAPLGPSDLERYAILTTLEYVGGSTSKAAEILGISPRKIQYRLNDYNLKS